MARMARRRAPRAFNKKSFAIAVLRRGSYRTPMRYAALKAARIANGRFKCAQCGRGFVRADVQVDHINSVVPVGGWDSFDGYIERLYCDPSGLQVLCKERCHAKKTKAENAQRKKAAKKAAEEGA